MDSTIETRLEFARSGDPSRYTAKLVMNNPARRLHEEFCDSARIELPGFAWDRPQLHWAAVNARKFLVEVENLTGQRQTGMRALD